MHTRVYHDLFPSIVAPEHLFAAWEEFRNGKRSRADVQAFAMRLEENIFSLHRDLACGNYRHGSYSAFTICDPKQRLIHKAPVRDRIVHHAIFSALNPLFESSFIAHSYSCRVGKGTHRAVSALESMLRKGSRNQRKPCFALKCDVHRFFASVDHAILLGMLEKKIKDEALMRLLREIIGSFSSDLAPFGCKGIPIGNLTSQLFANVYLNEFDQFMKHALNVKHFIRYTDDFVVVSDDEQHLRMLLPSIRSFLSEILHLTLHPHKVTIRKFKQGIDFLGYVLLPHHRVLRTKTRRRMLRKLHEKAVASSAGLVSKERAEQSLHSYLGVLSHADCYRLSQKLRNRCWFWMHSC
jgi:retron-type reverse transcriptase